MRRINLVDFRLTAQVIAEEFDSDWLSNRVQEAKENRPPAHPVPLAWAEIVDSLDKHERTGQLSKTGRMIWLASLGADLSVARRLPNYRSAIPYRLSNETEFHKAAYEVFVASWWAQAGHSVEFIPRQPYQRTADMRVTTRNVELFIECKDRDAYIQPKTPDDGDFWRELQFALAELRDDEEIGGNLELFVFVFGERNPADVPEIVAEVRSKLRAGFKGSWVGRQAGYLVGELKLSNQVLFLPAVQNPGFVAATVGVDNQGQRYLKDPMRITFFAIDSHKLSAVGNSFDAARRQIRQNTYGVIYINLDVSCLHGAEVELYADLVAASLATRFAPTINTRIAAIVVTTEPQLTRFKDGDRENVILSRLARIKRNPYRPLPNGVSIPGE